MQAKQMAGSKNVKFNLSVQFNPGEVSRYEQNREITFPEAAPVINVERSL